MIWLLLYMLFVVIFQIQISIWIQILVISQWLFGACIRKRDIINCLIK